LIKHTLKNALNPVVTAISGWLAALLAGAVFVEYIFDWKGMGVVIVDGLDKYDFPVVMGSLLYVSVILVLINILTDIIYGWLDPRVKLS
jgi:peptide/nickel transport system permease protein